jgi:uncharacterized protein (TIGR03435 family)
MPVFALVTVRSDKKLGPRIRATTSDCAGLAGQSTLKEKEGKGKSRRTDIGGGASPDPAAPGQRPPCTIKMEPGLMSASAMTMATLASSLSGAVPRTVLDRTGIAGAFEMKLTWTPDQMPKDSAGGNPSKSKGVKIDPSGPSVFTALREQLGLKLESTKGPVDVLVIDSVEHPREN